MNTTTTNKLKTLVLGSTGKTGSRVASRLTALNWPIRLGSRSAAIPFDWYDESTWDAAFDGMEAMYVSFVPDLCVPGSVELMGKLAKKAVEKGIQKMVMLSGRGEPEALDCEQEIINSGVADWTIVRASWFCQNFSEGNFLDSILAGHIAVPAGDMVEPFIDADDIADVAVAALTQDGHSREIYEVTGPRALTFKQAIDEIAKASGRQIRYETISLDEYTELLRSYQVPEEYVWLLRYLFGEIFDGRNAHTNDGVERALGRKPIDFSEYVQKTMKTGVWNQELANQ
jgi:uncharacterized protein YbjT (DUF2867 family)